MRPTWSRLGAVAAVALTTLMGIHAFRAFVAMVVWNIGEDRSAPVMGAIAFAAFSAGLLGWWAAASPTGAKGSGVTRAAIFAVLYALSHFVRHPLVTPLLAIAAAIGWLWTLPALIRRLAQAGAGDVMPAGIVTGFAWMVSLQTALHGLDMPMLRGLLPGIGATALAAALLAAWRVMPAGSETAYPGWGWAAFGPYLVLQLTVLANPGRVEMLTGSGSPEASLVILVGLAAGAAAAALPVSGAVRATAAGLSILLVVPGLLRWRSLALLPIAQLALAITLAAALAPGVDRRPGRTVTGGVVGLLVAFVLMFLYYSRYEWPALWPVLAAVVAGSALLRRPPSTRSPADLPAAAVTAVLLAGLLGVGLGRMPPPHTGQPLPPATDLRVLNYNIHMGFDAFGVPDPHGIARVIADADADVVALQEVGRGWTVNGGVDLFSWLRWRFPAYRAIYGPMNGELWGNALLSRRPVAAQGSVRFPRRESPFRRGLTWAVLPTTAGEVLVISTHFSHEDDAETDRLGQAGDVLAFWRSRPRTVLMGDFNAGPASAPITRLQASGLHDALRPFGLATAPTYPSPAPARRIDYVFITGDLEAVSGDIPRATASDHLPLVVGLRVR